MFALTFAVIGWVAPVLYASHVPSSEIITVHSFTAQEVNPDASEHYICFDRTVRRPLSGEVFAELYLIHGEDGRVEVQSTTMDRYFQEGRSTVITPLPLPTVIEEGTYRYLVIMRLEMADGRVIRTITTESEPFIVSSDVPLEQHPPSTGVC